jgi:Uma2 family endonuclease
MTAAKRLELIDWQTYLEGEARAKRKHEYVFGRIYAMAGAKTRHNRVARNVLGTLHHLLKGSPCEVFGSDQKVRIGGEQGFVFFYPDVLVDCDSPDDDLVYTDTPKIIVEPLSKSTRRIDEGQKLDLYRKIPSLAAYLLVESDQPGVTVWRRSGNEFQRETYLESTDSIPLPEIGVSLPLAEIYAGIDWSAVRDEEDEEEST